jgi:hypothetical protein
MNDNTAVSPRLERLLAQTLQYRTWLASAVTAFGLLTALAGWPGGPRDAGAARTMSIATIGIALFILLPILRVLLMLTTFVRGREYRLGAVAALVLAVIVVGFIVGAFAT